MCISHVPGVKREQKYKIKFKMEPKYWITNINIEPKNIICMYFIDSSSVSLSLFIELMINGLQYIPNVVMTIDISIERIKDIFINIILVHIFCII